MGDKFLVTNYDRNDLIAMIKETFRDELKEIFKHQEEADDYDELLSRKEFAELLKVSLVTIINTREKASCLIADFVGIFTSKMGMF